MLNYSIIDYPPLQIVKYSQCNYIFNNGVSISPSKPGKSGKNTITLNFYFVKAAYLILLTKASAILFSITLCLSVELIKN